MFGRDGKSRGFGFVLYKDEANNKKILGMESLTLEGRALDVKLRNSQPVGGGRFRGSGGGPPKSKKVFIGRLSDEVESADLREHFEQFGKIVDIFMPMVRCPASLLLLLLLCLLFLFLSSPLSSLL
jgi:RNA-binding protein Musashi